MRRERGVTLLLALLMLVCVMLIGVSAAFIAIEGEQAARAGRDGQVAFEAAEDALNDAERDIGADGGPDPAGPGVRRELFTGGAAWGDGCSPPGQGLAAKALADAAPAWERVDLTGEEDGGRCSLEFGSMTGASMQTGAGFLPFRRPRYVVERILCHRPGEDASAGAAPSYCYRVTVIGFGSKPETEVVLQSVYKRKEQGE